MRHSVHRHLPALVVVAAVAALGCQPGPAGAPPTGFFGLARAVDRADVRLQLGDPTRRPDERKLMGLGFEDTRIAAARVSVIGANMVREVKVVPWNGRDPLSVSLSVPVGNARLFVLEALDRDPAVMLRPSATPSGGPVPADMLPDPAVIAVLRTVANVPGTGGLSLTLNYQTDAVGRVYEALHDGLAHGFTDLGIEAAGLTDARREELLTAMNAATFPDALTEFVNRVTKYTAPTLSAPAGTYAGVHPLYFNADHLVGLLIKQGPTVLTGAVPQPLEAFRAVGEVVVDIDGADLRSYATLPGFKVDPKRLRLVLQTPFATLTDGGLAFADSAKLARYVEGLSVDVVSPAGRSAIWSYVMKDVPPGRWSIVAWNGDSIVGTAVLRVRGGKNQSAITVATTTGDTVDGPTLPAPLVLSGRVYDESGAPVGGAKVSISGYGLTTSISTSTTVIETGTTRTVSGYELAQAYPDAGGYPAGTTYTGDDGAWTWSGRIEYGHTGGRITVTKPGWTQRTRVFRTPSGASHHTVDFGAPATSNTYRVMGTEAGNAALYFISNHPEITELTGSLGGTPKDREDLPEWRLQFSEALPGTAIERIVNAARIVPANTVANAGTSMTDWAGLIGTDLADGLGALTVPAGSVPFGARYGFAAGTTPTYMVKSQMNEDGRTLSFSINTLGVPLLTADNAGSRFQFLLISNGQPIQDAEGKQLGTDHTGSLTAWPAAGRPVLNTIVAYPGENTSVGTNAAGRWAETHKSLATAELQPEYNGPPRLAGVASTSGTFSDATGSEELGGISLRVENVRPRYGGDTPIETNLDSLENIANYTFAFGKSFGDLDFVRLSGSPVLINLSSTTASLDDALTSADAWGKEVRFVPARTYSSKMLAAPATTPETGALLWNVSHGGVYYYGNLSSIAIAIAGRPNFFAGVRDLKVRAVNLRNVSGNVITPVQADAEVRRERANFPATPPGPNALL